MSIDKCSKCGVMVDTDAEPDSYVDVGRGPADWRCFCDECRPEDGGNDQSIAKRVAQRMREIDNGTFTEEEY